MRMVRHAPSGQESDGAGTGAQSSRPDAQSPRPGKVSVPTVHPPTAIHPEATDDPATLRWVVSGVRLPFAGPLERAPWLDDLLDDQVLVEVGVDDLLVTVTGTTWAAIGSRFRSALTRALEDTSTWVGGPGARRLDPTETLRRCTEELLDGPVGAIATAHGGSIELVDVRPGPDGGIVDVTMKGACRGCPAAVITMHQRLENQLRRRLREPVSVHEV